MRWALIRVFRRCIEIRSRRNVEVSKSAGILLLIACHTAIGQKPTKKRMYTVVLTCVAFVVDKTTLFCCWEINKLGGATVHHSVNNCFEVCKRNVANDQQVRSNYNTELNSVSLTFVKSLLKTYNHHPVTVNK